MKVKVKKIKTKTLHNKAWKLMSEYVRKKENGICYTCGKQANWKEMQMGHFAHTGRSYSRLDFDERNVHCQCPYCNLGLNGNHAVYAKKLLVEYGPDVFDEILISKIAVDKISQTEYEIIISKLKEKISELK